VTQSPLPRQQPLSPLRWPEPSPGGFANPHCGAGRPSRLSSIHFSTAERRKRRQLPALIAGGVSSAYVRPRRDDSDAAIV
jgi:hypothetical protein